MDSGVLESPNFCIFSLLPHRQCWMLIHFSSPHKKTFSTLGSVASGNVAASEVRAREACVRGE